MSGDADGATERSVSALGQYAMATWERNRSHRLSSGMDEELRKCLYQANAKYLPEELQKLARRGMENVYFSYSALKIRAAIAWLSEIFLNSTEKIYVLRPTPKPELSPSDVDQISSELLAEWADQMGGIPRNEDEAALFFFYANRRYAELDHRIDEEARKQAEAMERVIDDQFVEGKWRNAMGDVIHDLVTFGTGVLRGPTFRQRKRVSYVHDATGATTCKLEWKTVPEWEHIDPFDLYPSPGAVDINDGPLVIRTRLLPNELAALAHEPGYDAEKIERLLFRWPNGGLMLMTADDMEKRTQRNDGGNQSTSAFLEGIEFWGEVRGSDLRSWGMETDLNGDVLDDSSYYEANVLVFDGEAIYAVLTDERLGRPFYKGTYYETAGSWWGQSPCRMMRDLQSEMNAAKRCLIYNMAMASGPTKIINDINAIMNPEEAVKTIPWTTIIGKKALGIVSNGRPLVEFAYAPNMMAELSNMVELAIKHSDLLTEIPAYTHGTNVSAGASRTASGLAMLMDAAQRGIKHVIFSLDRDVMRPSIEYLYRLNLLTNPDPNIKGDVEIDAGGVLGILSRDKNLNFIKEFLVMLQDPQKAAVIGEEGLAALMREYVKMLQFVNPDDIVPSKEALEARRRQRELLAQQQQAQQEAMSQSVAQGASGGPTSVHIPQTMDGIAQLPGNGAASVNPDPVRTMQFQPNGIQAGMIEGGEA